MSGNMLDIVIPSYNNINLLTQCVGSLVGNNPVRGSYRIIVVNNGTKDVNDYIKFAEANGEVINTGENLGWERGLMKGLEHSTAPFVMFLNDDTFFPLSSAYWFSNLMSLFNDPKVGAVGPTSNVVAGMQNIWAPVNCHIVSAPYLIGFCKIVRKKALMDAGGIDPTLPGGDDFDLSIRLKDAGYKLLINRKVFVYHHGFVTGTKVHGDRWNGRDMIEATNTAIIKKHGFKKFYETITGINASSYSISPRADCVTEKQFIADKVLPTDELILDVGCGADKTLDRAIGVDVLKKGELLGQLACSPACNADINADIEKDIPYGDGTVDLIIARHCLEHCLDFLSAIKNCKRVLKEGGRMIIALPNEDVTATVPINPEHLHGFSPKSLNTVMENEGFEFCMVDTLYNGMDFISTYKKPPIRTPIPRGLNMVDHVKKCVEIAECRESKLNGDVFGVVGMSGEKVRHLMNNLCSYKDAKYLEIGLFKGSTFISANFRNDLRDAIGIDNFSFDENIWGKDIKKDFYKNTERILRGYDYKVIENHCFCVDLNDIGKRNIYLYDGDHSAENQEKAYTYYNEILDDEFITIIDDWRDPLVQQGTKEAFKKLNYTILYERELMPPSSFKPEDYDGTGWWNGVYVAVIKKEAK